MTKKKKDSPSTAKQSDLNQERLIKGFSELLNAIGVVVRREELKRGLGWRAQSGKCRAQDSKLLFVDRRSLLSEQTAVLSQAILEHKTHINEAMLGNLNAEVAEKVRALVA